MDLSVFNQCKEIGSMLPLELQVNRSIVEGNIVLCLWNQPELYSDYPLDAAKDFYTYDGALLYSLGKAMVEKQIVVFDQVAVEGFLANYPQVKAEIDSFGGVKTLLKDVSVVNVANIDQYYDDINKWNTIINMHERGFDVVKRLESLKEASAEEIFDFYEYLLNDSVKERNMNSVKISDMYISDNFLETLLTGELIESIGFGKRSPILNSILNGIPLGKVVLLSGHSGTGKSTFALYNYILPAVMNGEKCCIISNELTKDEYILMIINSVLVDVFNYEKVTRNSLQKGRLTPEDIHHIRKARDYINENMADNLKFVDFDDYDTKSVIKMIRKLSKVGYRLFLYDMMKADDSADSKAWGKIIEASKTFQTAAKRNNVSVILTYQIASHSFDRRWLNRGMLSQGKQIIEVVHNHIMLREIKPDEYTGDKYDIKAYRKKMDADGKLTKENEYLMLDRSRKYILCFVDKNRSGSTGDVILYEFKGYYAKFRELGFCNPRTD